MSRICTCYSACETQAGADSPNSDGSEIQTTVTGTNLIATVVAMDNPHLRLSVVVDACDLALVARPAFRKQVEGGEQR